MPRVVLAQLLKYLVNGWKKEKEERKEGKKEGRERGKEGKLSDGNYQIKATILPSCTNNDVAIPILNSSLHYFARHLLIVSKGAQH